MPDTAIDALSPLDGRYAGKLAAVRYLFSEAGLMRERVRVECAWVLALADGPVAADLAAIYWHFMDGLWLYLMALFLVWG